MALAVTLLQEGLRGHNTYKQFLVTTAGAAADTFNPGMRVGRKPGSSTIPVVDGILGDVLTVAPRSGLGELEGTLTIAATKSIALNTIFTVWGPNVAEAALT